MENIIFENKAKIRQLENKVKKLEFEIMILKDREKETVENMIIEILIEKFKIETN